MIRGIKVPRQLNPIKSPAKTEPASQNRSRIEIYFSIAMVCVTFVLACIAFWQATISNKATESARQSLELQAQSMEIANRAFMTMDNIQVIDFPKLDNFGVRVRVKNTGQTPAYELRTSAMMILREILPDTMITLREDTPSYTRKPIMLGKGETITYDLFLKEKLTPNQIALIRKQELKIVAMANTQYTDIFGKRRFVNFCGYLNTKDGSMTYCPKHNNAN